MQLISWTCCDSVERDVCDPPWFRNADVQGSASFYKMMLLFHKEMFWWHSVVPYSWILGACILAPACVLLGSC